jgi:hypothetical protein
LESPVEVILVMFAEFLCLVAPLIVAVLKALEVGVLELLVHGQFGFGDSLFDTSQKGSAPEEPEISALLGCCGELEEFLKVARSSAL